MRVTRHKTLMCNKLCNCLFSELLAKRPALDAWYEFFVKTILHALYLKHRHNALQSKFLELVSLQFPLASAPEAVWQAV